MSCRLHEKNKKSNACYTIECLDNLTEGGKIEFEINFNFLKFSTSQFKKQSAPCPKGSTATAYKSLKIIKQRQEGSWFFRSTI